MTSSGTAAAPVYYCERWNGLLHKPFGSLTPDEARARNTSGEPYGVVIGDPDQPDAFVDVVWSKNYVGVWFFDDERRRYLKYEFDKINDEALFMSGVKFWEYPAGAAREFNTATSIHTMSYGRDGVVQRIVKNKKTGEETVTKTSDVELDLNHEPMVEFGDWTSITRQDRAQQPS
jgi:hypothetical protein